MKKLVLLILLSLTVAGWAQSVADAARATRDKAKPIARKTITDDDLTIGGSSSSSGEVDWQAQLDTMRNVFRRICSDPKTQNGRVLSEQDRGAIDDAVKPLRTRIDGVNAKSKEYKEEFAKLEKEQEAALLGTLPKGDQFTDAERQKITEINSDYDSRRKALKAKVEQELKANEQLKNDVVAVGEECPAAAQTVK
jgi:hypothetical protein